MLAAIWAQDEQGLIGKENKLPWHLPNDLKFFKQMTEDNTIVMGRKTFEGMGSRPLPNRKTIVMTRDKDFFAEGVLVMHSIEDVLDYAEHFTGITFISGGAKIYSDFLPYCDVLYRTVIKYSFEGDTVFPEVDWENWTMINLSEGEQNDENAYPYQFETYQRKVASE
ncbi:dihydrofolate reductase [Enterococcus rivorum]|uniref:Dihydrofolate reductase n=1 Tax=Enterococcus rivorum TaxID=762845 RepID=A0A1E5KVX8_9ENTE|nr:dihydrofolate reductase [Enterococcus rivorum]MBP2100290.1 dihydrofolate reductase [Enterococcus rivorum]OEH82013.1 dihydrofolate reductase [Enterococcus rivorum]